MQGFRLHLLQSSLTPSVGSIRTTGAGAGAGAAGAGAAGAGAAGAGADDLPIS